MSNSLCSCHCCVLLPMLASTMFTADNKANWLSVPLRLRSEQAYVTALQLRNQQQSAAQRCWRRGYQLPHPFGPLFLISPLASSQLEV